MKSESVKIIADMISSAEVTASVKEKLMQIMRIETANTRVSGFKMTDYISKDPIRPVFTGVYYDESGYEVATEGHILVYRKANVPDDLKNKVVLPNGELLSEREYNRYPNWKAVVPMKSKDTIAYTIDIAKVEEFAKDWKAIKKVSDKAIAVVKIGEYYFKLDLLVLFCKALKFAETNKCHINNGYNLYFGDFESMGGVLMALQQTSRFEYQVYEL